MPSSKRKWKISTAIISLLSVGGAVAINNLWLNPSVDNSGSAANATKEQTVTGDAISYRYGVVQLEVTAKSGAITNIKEIQASTTPGWAEAVPLMHDAALKAGSADFGNVSGATFTTQAYKQALASALSKLG